MEQQMTTLMRHLLNSLKSLIKEANIASRSYVPTASQKHERFYGNDSIERHRGRSLCDLNFV